MVGGIGESWVAGQPRVLIRLGLSHIMDCGSCLVDVGLSKGVGNCYVSSHRFTSRPWQESGPIGPFAVITRHRDHHHHHNHYLFQLWIEEVHDVGFAGVSAERRCRIPTSIRSITQLSNLATKLIFASTCQHSATHTEALDLYGFVPGVPAMMRAPPTSRRGTVTKDVFARTLPDQFPDAYYGSLATVLQIHRPEEVCSSR